MNIFRIKRAKQSGFSLIEVVVFVALLNIVLLASVHYLITFTYQLRVIEHKTYALYYQEELKEWLDSEREADWTAVLSKAPIVPVTYCVNLPIALNKSVSSLVVGSCNYDGISGFGPQIFKRTVTLSSTGTRIVAVIEVAWYETSTNGSQVEFKQSFTTLYTQY